MAMNLSTTIQRYVAYVAIAPSTVRNQGAPRVVERARQHLSQISLGGFGTAHESAFVLKLDAETQQLMAAIPRGGRSWGLARKALDVFLRDCLYNYHLRRRYTLQRAEQFFELPLDSLSVAGLKHTTKKRALPGWHGVKRLTPEASSAFQDYARDLARQRGVARVHLDAEFWVQRD